MIKKILLHSKAFRIWLYVLSGVALFGLVVSFSLMIWAKDRVESGEMTLKGIDKGTQEKLDSGFAYQSRLYFARLDFLLRSKVIAYIDIQGISWASGIDKDSVSGLKSHNRLVKFITKHNLQGFMDKNLGQVEYKMDFSPLPKTIVKYFFIILGFSLLVRVSWILALSAYKSDQTEIKNTLKYIIKRMFQIVIASIVLLFVYRLFLLWLKAISN